MLFVLSRCPVWTQLWRLTLLLIYKDTIKNCNRHNFSTKKCPHTSFYVRTREKKLFVVMFFELTILVATRDIKAGLSGIGAFVQQERLEVAILLTVGDRNPLVVRD